MSSYTIAGDDNFDDVPVIAKPRAWGELISTFTTSHVSHPVKENQRAHSVTHTLLTPARSHIIRFVSRYVENRGGEEPKPDVHQAPRPRVLYTKKQEPIITSRTTRNGREDKRNEMECATHLSLLNMPFPGMERVHSRSHRNRRMQVRCGRHVKKSNQ